MKALAVAGLLVVAACASGGGAGANVGNPGGGDADANVRHVLISDINGSAFAGNADLTADAQSRTPATWHDVNASAAKTWQDLPVAYSKLGLAITRYDTTAHVIEGERLRSRADFGGKELTSLMDCGNVEGMPNATRFDVYIQTRTVVRGSGPTSSVASVVTASAKPNTVSGAVMPCTVNANAADAIAATVAKEVSTSK